MEAGKMMNAQIRNTMLGIEDHGIMTCILTLDYGGSGQGFGMYGFDRWDAEKKERVPSGFGCAFIRQILETVGVDEWEKLKGKYIRVIATHVKVESIGHIIEDRWFYPDDLAKLYKKEG